MRLTTVILIASLMQVSAATFGQRITINQKNAALESVLKEIRKQSGYDFYYDDKTIPESQKVSINIKNAGLEEALNKAFTGLNLIYEIDGKIVSIKKKEEPSFLDRLADRWNAVDLRGVVLDEKGQPLSGASVKVKGTSKTATTNNNGEFFLQGVNENAVLLVSYIGYQTKEIAASSGPNEIRLELSNSKLDEVLVIGYGTTTKRFNVGSVSKVTSEEISRQPVTNPLAALQGRVPGLVVSQSSGLPGASLSIQIRGQNSMLPKGNGFPLFDNPLFVINGVPFAPQNDNLNQYSNLFGIGASGTKGMPGYSPFNSINPSDIESIEVLKDADATAIYGSRGANGVILITTKRGTSGKLKLNANLNTAINSVTRSLPMMNTEQYREIRKEAFRNDGITPNLTPFTPGYAPDLLLFDSTKNTNWLKEFVQHNAKMHDANVSLAGGSSNTTFLIGTGYHHETFIFPGDFKNDRASVNANFNHVSTDKKFTLDFRSLYSYETNNSSGGPGLMAAFALPPNYPDLLNPDGSLVWTYKGANLRYLTPMENPLAYLKRPYKISNYNHLTNLTMEYKFIEDLMFKTSLGYTTFNSSEYNAAPGSSQDPATKILGSAYFGENKYRRWIIEPQLTYNKNFENSRLDITTGGTFDSQINEKTDIRGTRYSNDLLIESISAAGTRNASDAFSKYRYNGIFSRINYIYDKKYILNLTGRRDGSSRFGPGKQFGNFGSVGGGWIFTEEALVKKNTILSYGKIRASYGTTGNDAIGDYQFISNYGIYGGSFPSTYQGSVGYDPQNLFNPNFSWGVTKQLNLGMDFGLFKDRILGSVEYYKKRSSNQLVAYILPIQTGFGNVLRNAQYVVQNHGLEIEISSQNIQSKNFTWSNRFNISFQRNKLVSFPGIETSAYRFTYILGQPLSVIRGFNYLGVDPTTGTFQFEDLNKDGKMDGQLDVKNIGNRDPKFTGSLTNTFTYKEFRLDFDVYFVKQRGLNFLGELYRGLYTPGFSPTNLPLEFLNLSRWKNPGDVAVVQKLSSQRDAVWQAGEYFAQSSGAYGDASFIRFKTVSLSYNLPNQIVEKMKIGTFRIFANAQNLFTITNYQGNDPETMNFFSLPPMKTIAFGMQVSF